MGCVASKKEEEEDDVVSLCKDRKRLIKLAVERRYALADAQCKYNHSLFAVAAAIRLFVARHSCPSSSFLITFPSSETTEITKTLISNPMFFQQRPSEPTHETIVCPTSDSKAVLDCTNQTENEKQEQGYQEQEDRDGNKVEDEEEGDLDFRTQTTQVVNEFSQSSDEDLRVMREEEGIPELEEDGERGISERKDVDLDNGDVGHHEEEGGVVESVTEGSVTEGDDDDDVDVSQEEHKSLRVIDTPTDGRELLEALKDVEDHFSRAYDSGLEVSRMLEANRVPMLSGLGEIKESSNKLIRSITLNRSTSSRSSSCKSLVSCSSKSSSTWTESKNDLFDDYGGMESGSHSLTLGRLYAWEKKLYEEVKAGDETKKMYERKCSHLRNQDAGRDGLFSGIQKLRDEELQPQLLELINGLMKYWKIMVESHETQKQIMCEVKSFNCPAYGKFCNDSHRLATLQLKAEVQNWHACFTAYVSAQKAYIEALGDWLSKFIAPEVELYSKRSSSGSQRIVRGPPLLVICHDWLACLEKLPEKAVTHTMKSFEKEIRALWVQQGEEQHQKRKVDGLTKELDRKVLAFERAKSRILESKHHEQESQQNVRLRVEGVTEKEAMLDMFRKRLDTEKEKHDNSMQDTWYITANRFPTGFSTIFESLAEFSKASEKMYADLLAFSNNAKVLDENVSIQLEGKDFEH
uniref:DUF632 domain-containing protein n=1 Tax=Fagus sylvatica TaxID=28930 RepID=A0A2N9I222_FAGSY